MSKESAILLAIYFPLGLVVFALLAYMHDKQSKSTGKIESGNNIFTPIKLLLKVFYIAPIKFLIDSVRNRRVSGIIIFIITILLFVLVINLGKLMVELQ